MKAAFTKEVDFFATRGIRVRRSGAVVCRAGAARQLFQTFRAAASTSPKTNDHACRAGHARRMSSTAEIQERGKAILRVVEEKTASRSC